MSKNASRLALELASISSREPLDKVHGDVGFMAGGQLEGCILDFCDFAFGKEPESRR